MCGARQPLSLHLALPWVLLAFLTLSGAGGCSRSAETPEAAEADPVDLGPTTAADVAKAKAEMKERLAVAPPAPPPSTPATSEPAAGKPRAPQEGEQVCFVCLGKGEVPCSAPRCHAGYRPCPGPCFKRHEGTWVPYPGQPGVMARAVRTPDRKTYFIAEGHAGEAWVLEGGALVSKGPCPTCKGHRAVPCKSCKGAGTQECPVCQGNGAIPVAWTPEDNPWFNRQPDLVRLKDGRVFLGAESGGDELLVIWKTRAGEIITVPKTEVVQWPKPQ